MNELFKNEMKTILKDEYDDFIQSLQKPPVKAFYLNPLKKDCLHYFNQDAISPHPVVPDGYYFDYEKYGREMDIRGWYVDSKAFNGYISILN